MTALELFNALGPLVGPWIEAEFGRRDLCILATRIAIEVARYFGVSAAPLPVYTIAYNAAFASHVEDQQPLKVDAQKWLPLDGSWCVGIGFATHKRPNRWDGHLIAVADGVFGDFSVKQLERPEHGIITGDSIVGDCLPPRWCVVNDTGTHIEYEPFANTKWRLAPDWRDDKRRHAIVARIIKSVRPAVRSLAVRSLEVRSPAPIHQEVSSAG